MKQKILRYILLKCIEKLDYNKLKNTYDKFYKK